MTAGAPPVTLRPATAADEGFLRVLHESTREDLDGHPWDPGTRNAVLRLQFEAQERSWRAAFPKADFDVALVDGEPVGRLVVDRGGGEIHVLDIAFAPEHRGRGFGTDLLERVLAEADAAHRAVFLQVDRDNAGARRLYERLGFVAVGQDAFRIAMRREPVS
jgi:ribosomal protein S18 acetylase RimI-like enzyme